MVRTFFRAGHFDTEVYPSQTALQGRHVLLVGAYLLIVGCWAKVVTYIGGLSASRRRRSWCSWRWSPWPWRFQSDRVRLQMAAGGELAFSASERTTTAMVWQ